MKVPYFIPWIIQKDKRAVVNVLSNRWLTGGPIVNKFEEKISKFINSKFASAVGSATHALHLSVRSLGIGPGDEVIVPTFTFAATANVVSYAGAVPILADVDSGTFNILPSEIKKRISKRTRAIIVVHYGGQSCDMREIISICKDRGLYLIEDCAHSLGATYAGKKCGSMGESGCFSFYPTKIITTGEGGMVTTSNNKVYRSVQLLKSHGMSIHPAEREVKAEWKYDIIDLGYNYRMDEIRASLGVSQFERIDEINKRRIRIAKKYDDKLEKIKGISIPMTKPDRNHIYHLYTIKIENDYHLTRDELFQKLHKKGIGTSVQYYPLHLMSYNKKKYHNKISQFPNSNKLKDTVLSLPIYPTMTENQVDYVVANLQNL